MRFSSENDLKNCERSTMKGTPPNEIVHHRLTFSYQVGTEEFLTWVPYGQKGKMRKFSFKSGVPS